MINLDTHILVFALEGTVTAKERRALEATPWSISAIVLWELAKLRQLGRLDLDLEAPDVVRLLSRLHVWPIDLETSVRSTALDFRGDPADELIAATSVVHKVPLLTRDRTIRASRVVPLA
ncbi:MAG TPA: type II toxin-antitoxin system VapC family toxin [Polyangia bacterium]|nr:type II toxin-antitoxin system VapC family toxin [Polyangia bacterium]